MLPPASPERPRDRGARADKINHIVFVIKENRTFDNYFGQFPGADGATTGKTCDGGDATAASLRPTVGSLPGTASPTA